MSKMLTCKISLDTNETSLESFPDIREIEFDYIGDRSITDSSSITEYATANGDIVSDHMYREPITMRFSATYSMNGFNSMNLGSNITRLKDVEDLFTQLKNNGKLLTVSTYSTENNEVDVERFITRKNMVISSLDFTEKVNSVDISFSLQEVMTYDIVEEAEYTLPPLNEDDGYLLSDPSVCDFTDEFVSNLNTIGQIIIKVLYDENIINDKNIEYFKECMSTLTTTTGGKVFLGAATIATLGTLIGVSGPLGWLAALGVGAAAGIVYGIGAAISATVHAIKDSVKVKELKKFFKKHANDDESLRKINEIIETCADALNKFEDKLIVYGINQDTNQKMYLTIDGYNYIFTFTRNNSSNNYYNISISNINDVVLNNIGSNCVHMSLSTCVNDVSSYFLKTKDGIYIYLLNPELARIQARLEQGDIDSDEASKLSVKAKEDLTKLKLLVIPMNMDEFWEEVNKLIYDTIMK